AVRREDARSLVVGRGNQSTRLPVSDHRQEFQVATRFGAVLSVQQEPSVRREIAGPFRKLGFEDRPGSSRASDVWFVEAPGALSVARKDDPRDVGRENGHQRNTVRVRQPCPGAETRFVKPDVRVPREVLDDAHSEMASVSGEAWAE